MSSLFRHKNEYWLRSGFFTIGKNLSMMLLSLAGFYFLVRLLDKNDFGTWTLFLTTTTVLEVARNGLVCNGLIRFLSSAEGDDYSRIVTASTSLMFGLTVACAVLMLPLAPYLSSLWAVPVLTPMFYGYLLVFLCTGFVNLLNSMQQASMQFGGTFASSIVGPLFLFSYILLCWTGVTSVSLMSLLWVQLAGAVVALLIALLYTRRLLRFSRVLDWRWMRTLFGYGKYSFGTMVSSMVFSSIAGWMLGSLLAPAAAGAYSIATRITNVVEVPTSAVATIVFPQSAKRMVTEGKEAVRYLYEKSVGTILALLVPALLALFVFSGFAVKLLAGDQYAESIPILQVTLIYALLIPYGRQFGTMMDSIGKPDVNFKVVVLAAALNIGLNYLFIHRYGIIGAAYGTLCANIVLCIVGQVILRKLLGVRFSQTLVQAVRFYPEAFNKYLRTPKTPKPLSAASDL